MERDKHFLLTITAESPVHISSGSTLSRNIDFVYVPQQRTSFVVNVDAAAYLADPDRPDWQSLDQLLKVHEIGLRRSEVAKHVVEGIPLVRYMLTGISSNQQQAMLEQVKDVFDKPYIPGSSLKGAVRTALAWSAFPTSGLKVGLNELRVDGKLPKKEEADERYDHDLFVAENGSIDQHSGATDAHRDVMRGLRISDTTPFEKELQIYQVGSSTEQTNERQRAPIPLPDIEGIAPRSTCTTTIYLDRYLFEQPGFSDKADWIAGFAHACRERSKKLIQQEITYFEKRNQILSEFYQDLGKKAELLDKCSFMLQIGWGAGWHSKTFDDRLREDQHVFAEIVNNYGLQPQRKQPFAPSDLFPATRKLVLQGERPAQPLGWVRVDVEGV